MLQVSNNSLREVTTCPSVHLSLEPNRVMIAGGKEFKKMCDRENKQNYEETYSNCWYKEMIMYRIRKLIRDCTAVKHV